MVGGSWIQRLGRDDGAMGRSIAPGREDGSDRDAEE